jgi:transposase
MAGRPTKLTKELIEEIAQYLRAGNYIETTAALVGIHRDSIYEWLKRGNAEIERVSKSNRARIRKREEIFVEFTDTVKKAQAQAEAMLVGLIGQAAQKNWTAAAWRLERKYPDKWGRTERNVATAQDDPVKDLAKQIQDLRDDKSTEG